MHRIDGPAAAPGGFFTEGDPGTGTPATVVTDDFMNAVQEELVAVAVSAGDTLSKPSNDQVVKAIKKLIAALLPTGAVQPFALTAAPSGWLRCYGEAVSRAAYPALFTAIGTTFGAGDGSTTFNLPDIRDDFIRGWSNGTTAFPARALGSKEASAVQQHKHVVPLGFNSTETAPFGRTTTAGKIGVGELDRNNVWWHTNDGSDYDGAVNAGGVVASETRPRNIALLYCIKA